MITQKKTTDSEGVFVIDKKVMDVRLQVSAYYKSKTEFDEAGKPVCSYLLDNLMGLSSNQEMTEDVMANIYQEAVQTFYRKACEEATSIEGVSK